MGSKGRERGGESGKELEPEQKTISPQSWRHLPLWGRVLAYRKGTPLVPKARQRHAATLLSGVSATLHFNAGQHSRWQRTARDCGDVLGEDKT